MKIELYNAVKSYIAASLDFDVYGMRHQLYPSYLKFASSSTMGIAEEAIKKFDLDIVIEACPLYTCLKPDIL